MAQQSSALAQLVQNFTLGELAQRSNKSIEEIVEYALGGSARSNGIVARRESAQPKAKRSGGEKTSTSTSKAKGVNVRTAEGRSSYDKSVLDALRQSEGPTAATDLLPTVGGELAQLRAALHRLIESKHVKSQGRARGTRYVAR